MSRSRKKTAIWKQRNDKDFKRYANKRVRNAEEVDDGRKYKRLLESYDICDFRWFAKDDKEKARRK